MTRTEALKLLIEKCPEIVGPMLPTNGYLVKDGVLESLHRVDYDDETETEWVSLNNPPEWFYLALEARMGRWLRDEHECVISPKYIILKDEYGTNSRKWKLSPCPFTAHALAVIELSGKESKE